MVGILHYTEYSSYTFFILMCGLIREEDPQTKSGNCELSVISVITAEVSAGYERMTQMALKLFIER